MRRHGDVTDAVRVMRRHGDVADAVRVMCRHGDVTDTVQVMLMGEDAARCLFVCCTLVMSASRRVSVRY